MQAPAYAVASPPIGRALPRVWKSAARRSTFGDAAVVAFLLAQCVDGVLTYVGVLTFGLGIEANPIVSALMAQFGHGPGLTAAKLLAAWFGIYLHLREVHGAVAALTAFYVVAAIVPWTVILLF